MSRADPAAPPARPGLGRAVREAAVDFFFNGWAFLSANVAIGAVLMSAMYAALFVSPWLIGLATLAVLPAAGTMRMATRLRRDGHTGLGDFAEVFRGHWRVLLLGVAQVVIGVVLVVDVAIAFAWGSWIGTFLLVGAAYGIALLWAVAVVAWPILLDPVRDAIPIRRRLRLAVLVVVHNPRRIAALAVVSGVMLLAATVLIAPILTVALSLAWLTIGGCVLPLADELEVPLAAREA